MQTIITQTDPITFEEFLQWDDGSDRSFELIDGIPVPVDEPNANHEDVADDLCDLLKAHCSDRQLPYVPKRLKQIRLKTLPGEKERSRKPDIVIFAQAEWQKMKGLSKSAAAYICPPMVIEVVNNNWRDDYLTKLAEYGELGIAEYWIVDYAAIGGRLYIGNPKQPTISVYTLDESGEYQLAQFRGNDLILSPLFSDLELSAERVLRVR